MRSVVGHRCGQRVAHINHLDCLEVCNLRVTTPDGSSSDVLTPDGYPGSVDVIVGSQTVSQTITVDVSTPAAPLVTVPESGVYLVAVYGEVTNTTAATGTLAANLNNNGGPISSISQSMNSPVGTSDTQFVTIFSDLTITFDWSVSGFTTGSADIKIIASVIKLF